MAAAGGCQVLSRLNAVIDMGRVVAKLGIFSTDLNLECFGNFFMNTTVFLRPSQPHHTLSLVRRPHCRTTSCVPVRQTWTRNLLSSRCTLDDPGPIDGLAAALPTKLQRSKTCIPDAAAFRSYQKPATRGGCQERASLTARSTKQVVASTK